MMHKEAPQLRHMDAAEKMRLQQIAVDLQNVCREAGGIITQKDLKRISSEELFCIFIKNGIDIDFKINDKKKLRMMK